MRIIAVAGISLGMAAVVGALFVGVWGIPLLVALPVMLGVGCFCAAVGLKYAGEEDVAKSAWLSLIALVLLMVGVLAIGFTSVD